MESSPRRLLAIGHSYIVPLNRCLTNEMARIGRADWDITIVSPLALKGDFRPLIFEKDAGNRCSVEGVPVLFDQILQLKL